MSAIPKDLKVYDAWNFRYGEVFNYVMPSVLRDMITEYVHGRPLLSGNCMFTASNKVTATDFVPPTHDDWLLVIRLSIPPPLFGVGERASWSIEYDNNFRQGITCHADGIVENKADLIPVLEKEIDTSSPTLIRITNAAYENEEEPTMWINEGDPLPFPRQGNIPNPVKLKIALWPGTQIEAQSFFEDYEEWLKEASYICDALES